MRVEVSVTSLDELRVYVQELVSRLQPGSILLLGGKMGAGKTQLTSFLVHELGGEATSSPSYAIHESYLISHGSLEHFDLFRLQDDGDLESTGFWDILADKTKFVVIEWAERLREFDVDQQLPVGRNIKTIVIEVDERGHRRITED